MQPTCCKDSSAGHEAVRRVLDPIATRQGATIAQITLGWLLARSPPIMPIPGTTSLAHLRETSMRETLN